MIQTTYYTGHGCTLMHTDRMTISESCLNLCAQTGTLATLPAGTKGVSRNGLRPLSRKGRQENLYVLILNPVRGFSLRVWRLCAKYSCPSALNSPRQARTINKHGRRRTRAIAHESLSLYPCTSVSSVAENVSDRLSPSTFRCYSASCRSRRRRSAPRRERSGRPRCRRPSPAARARRGRAGTRRPSGDDSFPG